MSERDLRNEVPDEDRQATFERRKDVMAMYSDNAKTYMQLSGAALALTLTFAKQILHIPDTKSIVDFGTVAMWSCFLLAILLAAFYQFLAVKQLDAYLKWGYDKRWDKLSPGTIYGLMLFTFYAGSVIFTVYAIVQLWLH